MSSPFMFFLARKLLHKAHVALGFDRCYQFYVSAAPIEVKILKYFASLDIPIMELFGQSECTGPHCVNRYTAFRVGTVGRPLLGTETMIADGNGELCYRGRHIFAGYMGMPEMTNAAIDSEGWLHSGDVVTCDDNHDDRIPKPSGFFSITGRIKELIITAGGENVPPVLIEDHLKAVMPALSNAMVIGDKRKFLSVVFCLEVEVDADGVASNKLSGTALQTSKEIGSAATTTDEASKCPKWIEYFDKGVKEANGKATSRAQQVNKWLLLPTDFTEKGGELTPTLKLKRSVTAEKYSDIIEAMYA
jgi:long-chain-fatty-acid--CoA ligase ACSBG